jgi:hypothetical protein
MIYLNNTLKRLKKPIRRCKYYSHLISSKDTQELIDFIKKIGLDAKHLQHKGSRKEHFDLLGSNNYHKALKAGAFQTTEKDMRFLHHAT